MKNLITAVALLICFTFTSCSTDEDNTEPEVQEVSIVGTWFLTSISFDDVVEELSECDLNSNIILTADDTIEDNEFIEDSQFGCFNDGLSGTFEVSGENITFSFVDGEPEEVVETVSYSFEMTESTLSLSENGDVYTYTRE